MRLFLPSRWPPPHALRSSLCTPHLLPRLKAPHLLPPWLHSEQRTRTPREVKACEEIGVPFNANAIGGENVGVWPSACAIHPETVTRISTALAYYEPIKGQGNLVVIAGARAIRVIFQKNVSSKGVATDGVEYSKDRQLLVVSAKKEVILAAGTLYMFSRPIQAA
ncbi:hypothetical protein Hypma_007130 [Hypsizygus marmoreus]|uniref:Glucose-methanol-choline oxidoreductase N-terminal domain-containing protein n=1 Tax=Hypsizygus marmoreus TaxID=39966 RepID=A0A369KA21_HYPMA|nr:hypothetical protein Hypma_007130 [Hypsizygus marmoreus]